MIDRRLLKPILVAGLIGTSALVLLLSNRLRDLSREYRELRLLNRLHFRVVASVWIVAAIAGGCLNGLELTSPPQQPAITVTLKFVPDAEEQGTAEALGWSDGIPDVFVIVSSADSANVPLREIQTSDDGLLVLEQLPGGRYVIDAVRWLSDDERARLPADDDAVGFLLRIEFQTASTEPQVPMRMVASRRRGLVISEFKGDELHTPGTPGSYPYSVYVRLYNNSDTTMHLDKLIIGRALASQFDNENFPCSLYLPYARDRSGIWAGHFHQLPGSGRDYPLSPGSSATLAMDAIDHRPLYPGALDLRNADFEFFSGSSDVDNPDVPNALDVGVRSNPLGHGLKWSVLAKVAFVALPFDLSTMEKRVFGGTGAWGRIPAHAVLEVIAIKTTWQSGRAECDVLVDRSFDRKEVQILGASPQDGFLAYRRKTVPFTIGGQTVLQHTRTSSMDLVSSPLAPFASP